MIKDKSLNFAPAKFFAKSSGVSSGPSFVSPNAPAGTGNGNSSYGPGDGSAFSAEASAPDSGNEAISPLLQGLQSWGSGEPGGQPQEPGKVGQANATTGSAPAGQSKPPSEVPEGILKQVLNTLKTAGGMATVGALQSLLSWGLSELGNKGKIRPEFQDILHEAIDFAKENRVMSPEDLAKYESQLFAKDGKDGKDGKGGEKSGDCPCPKGKGKSAKDSLRSLQASA